MNRAAVLLDDRPRDPRAIGVDDEVDCNGHAQPMPAILEVATRELDRERDDVGDIRRGHDR